VDFRYYEGDGSRGTETNETETKRKKGGWANFFCAFCGKYEHKSHCVLIHLRMHKGAVRKVRKSRKNGDGDVEGSNDD